MDSFYPRFRSRLESLLQHGSIWEMSERAIRALEDVVWKRQGIRVIECFGDSHVAIFRRLDGIPGSIGFRFRCVSVDGATASGILNPNSKTNANRVFNAWLNRLPRTTPVLFMLGEVDLGFVIWWRAEKYGESHVKTAEQAVQNYTSFLAQVRQSHPLLIVSSVPLPTIRDGEYSSQVANFRREITASQKERTDLTLWFNRQLKAWCTCQSVAYLDLDPLTLDRKTGLIKSSLLNKKPWDHHYEPDTFCALLACVLVEQGILDSLSTNPRSIDGGKTALVERI